MNNRVFLLAASILLLCSALSCRPAAPLSVREIHWDSSGDTCRVNFIVRNDSPKSLRGKVRLIAYASRQLGDLVVTADTIAQQFVEQEFKAGDSEKIEIQMQTFGGLKCALVEGTILVL